MTPLNERISTVRALKELTLRRNLDLRQQPNTRVDFQISGKQQVVFTSSHSTTDLEIPHKLGVVPDTVILGVPSNDVRVYRGSKEWTRTAIYLRSSAACKVDVTPIAPDFPRAVFDGPAGIPAAIGGGVPVGANPTASVGLSPVNGVAVTFMRSDAAPPLSQAIEPTMTGAWVYQPSANNKIPIRIIPHATQNADLFRTQNLSGFDQVAINKEDFLRLGEVSGFTGTYPGMSAPYGGPNPVSGILGYGLLYVKFDPVFSTYSELFYRGDNDLEVQLTVGGNVFIDPTKNYTWTGTHNFQNQVQIITGGAPPSLIVDSIAGPFGPVQFLGDLNVGGVNIVSDAFTGTQIGGNGRMISFYGANPVLQYVAAQANGGHVGNGGTVLTHTDTWSGGSVWQFTIGDLFTAMVRYGLLPA